MTRRVTLAVLVLACAAALWYLRDPPWLIDQTTGLQFPVRGADGITARWSGRHAAFFVPSSVRAVRLPVSTTFDAREPGGDRPMLVTFTIDDQRAGRLLLSAPGWQEVTLTLPPAGRRRVRRVDIRTSITREGNHGVLVGEWRPCCF